MRRKTSCALALLLFAAPPVHASEEPLVRLSEIVADPQTDWNQDGRITASDEYVELRNVAGTDIDLAGWILRVADSTPSDTALAGTLAAGEYRVVLNPSGDTNNDGHVLLLDAQGRVHDEVRYGAWPQTQAPTANADGPLDESLRRLDAWTRGPATPNRPNDALGWRQSTSLALAGAWVAPNSTAWLSATVLADASDPVRALRLYQDDALVRDVRGPAQMLQANVTIVVGNRSTSFVWHAERHAGNETRMVQARVDGEPPVWIGPRLIWRSPNQSLLQVPPAHDVGVGGVQYRFRANQNASAWSAQPAIAHAEGSSLHVQVRDAFNNTSPWLGPIEVRTDDAPPRILGARVDASGTITWEVDETGSGVAAQTILAVRGRVANTYQVSPDVRSFTLSDATDQVTNITLTVTDEAGNAASAAGLRHVPDGARPSVVGIRFSKSAWASGVLEARIDFDRPMDTARPPEISTSEPLTQKEARYLGNRSTYFVSYSPAPADAEGELQLTVVDAVSRDGLHLRAPAARRVLLDTAAPRIQLMREPGAPVVNLSADDASSTLVSWKLYFAGEARPRAEGASPQAASLAIPGDGHWRLKAVATDAHGHRSRELVEEFVLDRAPPSVEAGNASTQGIVEIRVQDVTSGVDWFSANLSEPTWWLAVDPARKRVTVQAAPGREEANFTIFDKAGNRAIVTLRIKVHSYADALSSAGLVAPEAVESAKGNTALWWPSALALVGGVAAAIPLHRHRVRRRRNRSFARRLRRILAETAPNGAVKDASAP